MGARACANGPGGAGPAMDGRYYEGKENAAAFSNGMDAATPML